MKTTITLFIILSALFVNAQQSATTESGKKVILYDNGKWEYVKYDTSVTDVKMKGFVKPRTATTLVKSEKNDFGVWYDPKKWKVNKDRETSEFFFTLVRGDGYAMAITERIQIGMENFKEMALGNARNAAPDIEVDKEEERTVNGVLIKYIQMSGTIKGIKFTYAGYYCSNESGSIQLLCFTGKNLFKDYAKDFEDLLNGLVTLQK
jgi:hypothetical protein